MVLKIQHNSSGLAPGNYMECLICLETSQKDESKYVPQVSEILSDLFEILCKYMEWSPPLKYQFNFKNEIFPFCKECKSSLVTLYKSHQLIADAQKQTNSVISKLCGKILLSQNDKDTLEMRNRFNGSSQNSWSPSEEIQRKWYDKVSYYRDLVSRRYSASVRVTAYAPISVASPKTAIDENCPEERIGLYEGADFDLEVGDSHDGANIDESLCDEQAKEDENTYIDLNIKQIVSCSEASDLFILNRRTIPLKKSEEKNFRGKSSTSLLSDDLEVFSEVGQTEDIDRKPSSVSQKNGPLDDDVNCEDIVEPSMDALKVRAHFEPGRGKFFDRVRNVGNDKYLFDEKYAFEHNSENKWVCSSCKHPYTRKDTLLDHLAKICKSFSSKKAIDKRATEICVAVNKKADFDLEIDVPDDTETVEERLSDQGTKDDENTDIAGTAKRIVRCSEVSELLVLNHRRIPKRNFEEKNEQGKLRLQILSDDDEVSSEVGQEDSDYEPSIASKKNESLDDDGNFEEIAEPVVDGVKVRNHFEPGCGKFFDRVRNVGNDKYLFDEKYSFELNQNKWVCSSCNHPYNAKTRLLEHLAKICKVASPRRREKARKGRESDSDFTDDMEEDADSSDYENVREFPLPQSFTGELPIPPLFVRRRKIRNKVMQDIEGTEYIVKTEDNLSVNHIDSTVEINGYQDNVPDVPIPEGTDKNITDEVQIRVESNVFQRQEFQNRIQKIGPSQYLLDDKVPFEFQNRKWRCIPCKCEYAHKENLMNHFDSCPGNPPTDSVETLRFKKCVYDKLMSGKFQCRHCKQLSSSNDDAIVHLQRCHKPRPKKPGWVELELNKFLCHNKYPFEFTNDKFKCGTCTITFTTRGEILDHIRSKHIPELGRKHMSVTNSTPDKFIVNDKFSFEKVEDEYRCCECIYSSVRMDLVKTHMREKHINSNKFSCGKCRKQFARKEHLTLHETSHLTNRTSVCETCGKSYKSEHGLKMHRDNAHLNNSEKPFTCTICGKAFRVKAMLNSHSKSHERAMCDVCGKDIRRYQFKEHVASHSKVKIHECKKCGKKYQRSASLYVHMKSHDGVKPYSCDICGMKFTQQYSVIRHKNIAHNPNKPTKTYAKSRKRKREEVSSEEEETDEEELFEEQASEGEDGSSSEEISEEEEA